MATDLYNFKSLGALAGTTGAAVVVTNALKTMFGINLKWLSWVVSEMIYLGVLAAPGAKEPSEWGLALLNGSLVYTSAIGTNAMGI